MKINKIIHAALLIAATSVATSALAGEQPKNGVTYLDCVQYQQSKAAHKKDATIRLECVENKAKKNYSHAYHEKTDNPED